MRRGREKSGCKMSKMWIVLECECSAGDPKVRIYLSGLRESRWPKVKKACQKACIIVAKILTAAALTFPIAIWSVRSAYLERGYRAYGGEWLLIIMVYLLCYKILGFLLKE